MSEILYFEIQGFYQNSRPLTNASCTFILGSQSIDSPIPTKTGIKIKTQDLNETETLLILFKENNEIVAKVTSTLRAVRNNVSLDYAVEPLRKTDENKSNIQYAWTHSYYMLQDEIKRDNPFTEGVLVTPGSTLKEEDLRTEMFVTTQKESPIKPTNQSGFDDKSPSFDAEGKIIQGNSPSKTPHHDVPAKVKADFYLSLVEAKLESAVKADSALAPEISHILNSLKLSIEEIAKAKAVETVSPILPHHSINETSGSEHFSPKFGKEQFSIPGPSSERQGGESIEESPFGAKRQSASRFQNGNNISAGGLTKDMMSWRVQEEIKVEDQELENMKRMSGLDITPEKTHNTDDDEAAVFLKQMEGEEEGEQKEEKDNSDSESYHSEPDPVEDSLAHDVQLDRNQDFLIEVKNMLNIKTLTHINDDFTRELVMQMARGKKKVVAFRLKHGVKLRNKDEVEFENKNYFREGCGKQILHFFLPYTKYLCLFNLVRPFEVMDDKPNTITLDIDFDISPHHKSIITPSGLIFIVSGKTQPASPNLDDSTGSLHVYNYNCRTLVEKPSMSVNRIKNFGLCYMSKNLFVVGGIVNGIISNYCERYDVRSNEWLEIAPMNKKLKDVSVCSFNNRYVYRFFGLNANNQVDTSIERYDAVRDKWALMNISVPESLRGTYMPLCTQINQDYIFLFGGRTSAGYPSKNSRGYVLKIEDKRRSVGGKISETKSFVAGLAGNFSQNNMIAHNGDVLFLRESY